jgi:YesN/AraC family two-component response regulator
MSTVKILVVDDEKIICRGCEKILSDAGYGVKTTLSAKNALDMLKEEAFDIVITDLKMPEMSGTELLKIIKQNYPHISVIVITGYSTVETAIEAMQLGAFDYLPKPFTSDQVNVVIQKVLERKNLLEEAERGKKEISKAQQIIGSLPTGIIVVNAYKKIVDINSTFTRLIGYDDQRDNLKGRHLSYLHCDWINELFDMKKSVDKKISLPDHNRTLHFITFPLQGEDEWVGMLVDNTRIEQQREEIVRLKGELLEKSQEVIDKQMRVAQEIAGLLGETTAETKTTLLKLIDLAKKEEGL